MLRTLRRVRDRIAVKLIAESAGLRVVPWNGGPLAGPESAVAAAEVLGYPVMLKAAAGGGRAGIRRVDSPAELLAVIERAAAEAHGVFDDATLYLEALLEGARHLDVTVVADAYENVWTFGPNDATLRRRGDKVVIESAGAGLTAADTQAVLGAASTLVKRMGYRGVATVAFIHVPRRRTASLPRVLPPAPTRARPHRGDDRRRPRAPAAASRAGRPLGRSSRPAARGVALQARLNAEDPERGFAPAPGVVARLRLGTGPGVRVDAAVAEGDLLAPGDPMLVAQVLARGPSRDEARIRLRRALDETTVVIDGGSTNKGFLLDVLDRAEVREARVDNAFVDRHRRRRRARHRARRRRRPAGRRDRRLRDRTRRGSGPLLRVGPSRSPPDHARGGPHHRAPPPRAELPGRRHPPRPEHVRRRARRGDRGAPARAARTVRAAGAPGLPIGPRRVGRAGRRPSRRGRRHSPPVPP